MQRCLIGNQCRSLRTGMILENLSLFVVIPASLFWSDVKVAILRSFNSQGHIGTGHILDTLGFLLDCR